jgi:photosystem II stability/assembly factor-like uncharacterized protein
MITARKYARACRLIVLAAAWVGTALGVPAQDVPVGDLMKSFSFRAVGPARQNGRILHVAVNEKDPYTFYIAPSTGGLWKTVNNGTTFASILPRQSMVPIGHMTMAPSDPNILWVGTGDAASGRIPLRGFGVWKSADAGSTWTHMGLAETRHIGRIAVHPRDPNTVYVAAVGYHFSFNPERGLYKTTDGGKTWERILFISEKVGVVDVVIDPRNPNTVFAATYDKQRIPWNFDEGGPETGIYRSRDAGKTWARLAGGLPGGKLARAGLAIFPKNPNILYAVIDNQNRRPLTPEEAKQPSGGRQGASKDRPIGGEVYRSDNGGDTWKKMNSDRDSIGGGKWYGWIYIDPNDENIVYVPNVSFYRSVDAGKTWGKTGPENIASSFHVDYHAFWIDPRNSNHLILGSDGGLAVSYDFGKTWDVFDHLPLAQYYAIGVDMEEPYNIYGGLQDNGSVKIPSNGPSGEITRDDWRSVGGGDGMMNVVDPEDSRWLFNESQNGAIQRVDQRTGISRSIRPARAREKEALRFNWTAPIALSPHNSRILYLGAQVVFRSLNRGDSWQEISPDLTTNDPEKRKGNIEFCTLTTIAESPVTPGIIWAGADDGKVQVTRNSGAQWTDTTAKLAAAGAPEDYFVTRIFPSNHKEGTAYVAKAGWHRDVYKPYVFKTEDFGETWSSATGNLPEGTVYAVIEDRKNPGLLFVGTEMGVFGTLDGGKSWAPFGANLPPYALVNDLLIHPRDNDLVVATHGRGLFIADIVPLQEMKDKFSQEPVYLFEVESKIQWMPRRTGISGNQGERLFHAPNEPNGLVIHYFLKQEVAGKVTVRIATPYGEEMAVLEGQAAAGLHSLLWDMRRSQAQAAPAAGQGGSPIGRAGSRLAPPGEYLVVLEIGDKKWTRRATIRRMPGLD